MTTSIKDLFNKFLSDNGILNEFYEEAGDENKISYLPLEKYISAAFKWKSTPQGFNFWSDINEAWEQTLAEFYEASKYTLKHEKRLVAIYPAKVLDKDIKCPENSSIELYNNHKFVYEHIYKPVIVSL